VVYRHRCIANHSPDPALYFYRVITEQFPSFPSNPQQLFSAEHRLILVKLIFVLKYDID
jgi:hypothetical protein